MIPGSPATAALRHLLTELGRARHTGALHVDGTPGGTVYLVAGRVTYAESPAVPGVDARLIGSGRLSAHVFAQVYRAGYAECRVGALLVQRGHLEQGELTCRVLATICDATHAVLQGDGPRVHFVPNERHWLGQVTQIELTVLAREAARRAAAQRDASALNALPVRRAEPRATNAGPPGDGDNSPRFTPDYATLKRIRRSLKSID